MIFADHIQGIDNRIELRKLRTWNTTPNEADKSHVTSPFNSSRGLVIYDTNSDALKLYGLNQATSINGWRKVMDELLPEGKVWWGDPAGKAVPVQLLPGNAKPGGNTPSANGITISQLAPPGKAVSFGGHPITNLGPPGNDTDAVTKEYVDGQITSGGARILPAAKAATNSALTGTYSKTALTITANANAKIPVVDSVTLQNGDVLLVKNQGTTITGEFSSKHPENGLYTVQSAGSASTPWVLKRHDENDYGAGIPAGGAPANEFNNASVAILNGTRWAATSWGQHTPYPTMDGTTPSTSNIEWRVTKTNAAYRASDTIKIDDSNGLHFLKDPVRDGDFTTGSLFVATGATTIDELVPSTNGEVENMPFLQVSGPTNPVWNVSQWNLPVVMLKNAVLATADTSFHPTPIVADVSDGNGRVLGRKVGRDIEWLDKLPAGMVDLDYPIKVAQGGTGKDLINGVPSPAGTSGSYVTTWNIPEHSRHGLLFRLEGNDDQMELTRGPETTTDRILMHKGYAGTPPSGQQGRNAWDWVDLWDRDNHFKGRVTVGKAVGSDTMCSPAMTLKQDLDTVAGNSPGMEWVAKFISGTVKRIGWTAMARLNGATAPAGSSAWVLARCVPSVTDPVVTAQIEDIGHLVLSKQVTAVDEPFLSVAASSIQAQSNTWLPGKGTASLRFVSNFIAGYHAVVDWKAETDTLGKSIGLGGSSATRLFWRGEPIGMDKGGWGADISGYTDFSLFFKGTDKVETVPVPVLDNPPLLGIRGGAPRWAFWSLPSATSAFAPDEVGGVMSILSNTRVGVRKLALTSVDVDTNGPGACRKYIKEIHSTTSTFDVVHNLNTRDVVVSVRQRNEAVEEQVYMTVVVASVNKVTLRIANADASKEYTVTIIG